MDVGVEHRRGLCSQVCHEWSDVVSILAEDASGVGFGRMLRLSSVPDAEKHYRSISEYSHLACARCRKWSLSTLIPQR